MNLRCFGTVGRAAALLASAVVLPGWSQAAEPTMDQELRMIRSQAETEREAMMAANVIMTDAEAAKFWPIYHDYRSEVAKIGDARIALMKDLAANFDALTDAKAKSITDGWFANERQRLELKAKYAAKYDKVLSAVKTARVLQIENRLDVLVDVGLTSTIPLVTPPTP